MVDDELRVFNVQMSHVDVVEMIEIDVMVEIDEIFTIDDQHVCGVQFDDDDDDEHSEVENDEIDDVYVKLFLAVLLDEFTDEIDEMVEYDELDEMVEHYFWEVQEVVDLQIQIIVRQIIDEIDETDSLVEIDEQQRQNSIEIAHIDEMVETESCKVEIDERENENTDVLELIELSDEIDEMQSIICTDSFFEQEFYATIEQSVENDETVEIDDVFLNVVLVVQPTRRSYDETVEIDEHEQISWYFTKQILRVELLFVHDEVDDYDEQLDRVGEQHEQIERIEQHEASNSVKDKNNIEIDCACKVQSFSILFCAFIDWEYNTITFIW